MVISLYLQFCCRPFFEKIVKLYACVRNVLRAWSENVECRHVFNKNFVNWLFSSQLLFLVPIFFSQLPIQLLIFFLPFSLMSIFYCCQFSFGNLFFCRQLFFSVNNFYCHSFSYAVNHFFVQSFLFCCQSLFSVNQFLPLFTFCCQSHRVRPSSAMRDSYSRTIIFTIVSLNILQI